MSGIHVVTSAILAVVALATTTAAQAANVDASLRAELERVAQRRIFFGHQSVGGNLLDGVRQLATMTGVPVRVVEAPTASSVKPATIGHTPVARNGDPFQKLQSFEKALGDQPTGLDIALVKFCYVDINASTDAKALFARYRATIDGLQAKNPGTTFVHVTAPLTVVQSGLKESLKRLFGRAPYGTIENLHREEYNTLLRQAYLGREPLFDLARVESTAPDGTEVKVEWKGSVAPAMAPAYTDDGGHLNAAGRLRAARELVSVLAAIPDLPLDTKPAR
ncbi:MAG: hypothetical protein OEV15_09315 [Gallionella sp.]|nr:hypothetical protein [Gallionella sp.]